MILSAGKYWGLSRLADSDGRFKMVALDQRPPIVNPIREKRGGTAPWEDVAEFKRMLVEELQSHASAMLLDPHYAYPASLRVLDSSRGLILTLEDSVFDETPDGRLSRVISDWSIEKIKRVGGDAVKVLAWYRPDAGKDVVRHQQNFIRRIGDTCAKYDLPFVLELLVYPLAGETEKTSDYVEMRTKRAEDVLKSVETFAAPEYGVDLYKLESPVSASQVPGVGNPGWEDVQQLYDEMGRVARVPWVMLSAGSDKDKFKNMLSHAYKAGASGFLAGRAIWLDAFQSFPDWDAIRHGLKQNAIPYLRDLNAMADREAQPWHHHPVYGDGGAGIEHPDATFRIHYSSFGTA